MLLDTTNFPIVRLQTIVSGELEWEKAFSELLSRGERFVLVRVGLPDSKQSASSGERKQHALWLKSNRRALSQWCAGAIVIQRSRASLAAARMMAPALAKAFGFPVIFVEDENCLDVEASKLLTM